MIAKRAIRKTNKNISHIWARMMIKIKLHMDFLAAQDNFKILEMSLQPT